MKIIDNVNMVDTISRARRLIRAGLILATGIGLALTVRRPAQALSLRTFTLLNDSSQTQTVNMSDNGGATFGDFSAGRYLGSFDGGPAFYIFCIDASHVINYGNSYSALTAFKVTDAAAPLTSVLGGNYYLGGLSSALTDGDFTTTDATSALHRSDEAAWLIDQYLNATAATFAGGASGSTNLVTNLAAVQLSIWDIIQDGGDGLGTGSFRTNGAAQTTYGSMVGYYETLAAGHSSYVTPNAIWIQSSESPLGTHAQDFATNTPEPDSLAIFVGLSISGAGFFMGKRRRK
jgi:hypothetical protein